MGAEAYRVSLVATVGFRFFDEITGGCLCFFQEAV